MLLHFKKCNLWYINILFAFVVSHNANAEAVIFYSNSSHEIHHNFSEIFNVSDEYPEVSRFREYLRTNFAHPNPNYDESVMWIKHQAEEIGLEYQMITFPTPGSFAISLKWRGSEPSLKSIMFNSHIDVVPVDRTKWLYDPFAAFKDSNGNIYARGSQDRKSLGSQHLEAIRILKSKRFAPMRSIYVTFVPDEELGGDKGMLPFVKSKEFKRMNVGLEFDEGGATLNDEYEIFYRERVIWQFKFIATGKAGHAAFMDEDNAAIKLAKVIEKLLAFRKLQLGKLKADPNLEAGDVTSINLSQLGGGVQPNVIPAEMWAIFDMRIKVEENWQFEDVQKFLDDVCNSSGPGVRYEFIVKYYNKEMSSISDRNFWWKTISSIFRRMGWKLRPKIFPGGTDARHLRAVGIPAYGLSPLLFTEPLQHQDNEYLNEKTYLDGIQFYEKLIPNLSNAI